MSLTPAIQDQTQGAPPEANPLTETVRAGLLSLFQSLMKEEQTTRRSEVRNAWEQRSFRNGIQHLWWDERSYTWCLPAASGVALPAYMDVYDIFTPHWRSFVSLLSQNPPGVNFVPNDLQSGTDVAGAAEAEKARHSVDRLVCMKDRQMEAASMFCTDGRTIAWTYIDANGRVAR